MSSKMVYNDVEVDVGNPRRPFKARSARLMFRSLKDVETGMNYEERMLDGWLLIPRRSMEERLSAGVVKELLVRTEADLKMAKRWLVARNLMATGENQIIWTSKTRMWRRK